MDLAGKAALLQSLSVFCLPSRNAERRAMACLEAMAAGVPAVVPSLGLFPELVELTGGGLLVPAEDADAVAHALAGLMDDPDGADRMGRAAAEGVAAHFSAEMMTDRTLRAYERALAAALASERRFGYEIWAEIRRSPEERDMNGVCRRAVVIGVAMALGMAACALAADWPQYPRAEERRRSP